MSDDNPAKDAVLLTEAIGLMSFTTVGAILYTLSLVLYCYCARLLYWRLQGLDGKRQTVLTFSFTSIMIICATINVVINNQFARVAFIDYISLPGDLFFSPVTAQASKIRHTGIIAALIGQSLALGVLLWRVWVVFSGTHFAIPITVLALLLYLVYVVLYILLAALIWVPAVSVLSNLARTLDILATTCFSLSAANSIIMAFMIATRLVLVRRKHIKVMGKTDIATQYLSIAAMLIESYALSTAWNIGNLIAYILRNPPARIFFSPVVLQSEFLSYFLVLYQVFSGRAWDHQTHTTLSTMQFNHSDTQTTSESQNIGIANTRASNIGANLPAFTSHGTGL